MKSLSRMAGIFLVLFGLTLPSSYAQQTGSVTGVVTDATDGQALGGANVILTRAGQAGLAGGAAANIDGMYLISNVQPGTYTVTVRFVGYNEAQFSVTVAAGQTVTLNATLSQGGLDLNTIVITASRQAEKVLDAPASISVLDAREIEQEVVPSTVSVLRNVTGVDVAQTGVDRNEVVLRGFNNAFSGSAYVLTDYRQAAVASLGVNLHSIMPNMGIDVERIEVVRGPGSALYGAGVDEGVVHYITKDPFSYPGTTISLSGGERSMLGAQFRHAGVLGGNLGYKVTGYYSQAKDWEYDPNNAQDAFQLGLDADGLERNYDFSKLNVNGMLQYRVQDNLSLTVNGGYSSLDAIVLSGIGTLQSKGFGYTYGQFRLQADRFFAQFYVNKNDAGDSFVYGNGVPVVDKGVQYSAQAQYDLSFADDRFRLILGGDLEMTRPDTEGTILGRNDANDDINEVGGYAQSTIEMTPKLDLTLAVRGDWSNVFDEFQVSPRAALVYKVNTSNTVRASYNKSFSSPGVNSLFLDIVGQVQQLDADRRLIVMGRGSGQGYTFDTFRATNSAQMFLPVTGFFGQNFNLQGMPLIPIYGAAAGGGLVAALRSAAPIPGLESLNSVQRGLLADLLGYTALNGLLGLGAITDATQLGIPDDSEQGFREVNGPVDIAPLKQTTTQTIEVGYKGLINGNILFAVDGYWANKKNFTGPLLVESPFVYLDRAGLTGDVGAALGALFATSTDATVQALLAGLQQAQLPAANVAGILGALVGGALEGTPIAAIQSDQQVLPDALSQNAVGGFAAYRNFGNLDYWGVDASLQILATDALTLFGNISIVSDDFFDNTELDEENVDLELALNAPTFKGKFGGSYRMPSGLSLNASGRYTKGFPVRSGSDYIGNVEDYFLLDLGAGFDFGRTVQGLRVDFTIQNLLDNAHREFVGAPLIGRMGIARLTYTF
ncbi:MAG: TonB-dependent receptor [Rhodothermales bacterium]